MHGIGLRHQLLDIFQGRRGTSGLSWRCVRVRERARGRGEPGRGTQNDAVHGGQRARTRCRCHGPGFRWRENRRGLWPKRNGNRLDRRRLSPGGNRQHGRNSRWDLHRRLEGRWKLGFWAGLPGLKENIRPRHGCWIGCAVPLCRAILTRKPAENKTRFSPRKARRGTADFRAFSRGI